MCGDEREVKVLLRADQEVTVTLILQGVQARRRLVSWVDDFDKTADVTFLVF